LNITNKKSAIIIADYSITAYSVIIVTNSWCDKNWSQFVTLC